MAVLWQRLRDTPRAKGAFLLLVVALLVLPACLVPTPDTSPMADAERVAFDWQMRLLRRIHPRPLQEDIVLVGIDEGTYAAFTEPFALWHRHFGEMLQALARARPRAVGVDVQLPERSYDSIAPGLDLALMRGLVALKRATKLVYVQGLADNRVDLLPIQPNFRNIMTPDTLGLDQQRFDPDLVSRRFEENILRQQDRSVVPTLAGQMLRAMDMPVDYGYIDYSLGAPLEYIPMQDLAQWDDARLRQVFEGKVVLVGSLIGRTDRWRLPVRLLARDPGRDSELDIAEDRALEQPGVLTHAQVLRSQISTGILHPIPAWIKWLAIALAALVVFVRASPAIILAIALNVPFLVVVLGNTAIVSSQALVPVATIILTFWTALIVRAIFDAIVAVVERVRLQQSFAGQVSPSVMKEMLGGTLAPGVSGQAEVCVLFSDVRDFTTLSENMPPEMVTAVLRRYFDRMVHAVHKFDATVDKFIGDGMMVLFGAPLRSRDPCGDAVQCALEMMRQLDELNAEFAHENLPQLTIGIGINYGTVTVGYIGSSERHNYSAIGDAVNVAARVEGLTKDLGRKIIITEAVVTRIEAERFHFDPLGAHKVKGHSPVMVWGIRTARAAPAVKQAEAVQ